MPTAPLPQVSAPTLSPTQLQHLWVSNGGSPKAAPMAAAIAMAESSGRSDAINHNTNGTVDRGAWQINSIHGPLSTLNPIGNVKAAIAISRNGTDWTPWTTFNTGAYKQYLGPAVAQPARVAPVKAALPIGTVAQARPGVPQNPVAERIRANILNGILPGLGSQASQQKLGLYSPKQANVLNAHQDLQTLAGTTTLSTHPSTGEGGQRLSAMVKAADSLVGKPYVWGGGHSSFGPQSGYDCSGFVSAVLHAGGFLNSPQTTQTLPSQPGIAQGPGKFVTIFDRTNGGTPGNDHVIIDLNGAWYESGGQAGAWGGGGGVQRIRKPSAEYLQSFNRALHPLGM